MEILLERIHLNEECTEGKLFIDGTFFCYTIEDKVRAKPGEWKTEVKVYGKTAIPYGKYPVLVTWSNRFKRQLTGVFNVQDFEGIRLHNGVNETSSAGCIIVSKKQDPKGKRLINDKTAMNELCDLVAVAQKKEKVWLKIVDKKEDSL
jgi:hypothetical protein